MKPALRLFRIGWTQIKRDGMLLALLPSPFLAGLIFRIAIPAINDILEERLSVSLTAWYRLVDGFLSCLTPLILAMVFSFLLLEERDEGIGAFYQITPAGGYPYLAARIGMPMAWSFVVNVVVLSLFTLSDLAFSAILLISALNSLAGLVMSLMVVSLAGNRVEGLALSKLMGVSFLGLLAEWCIPAPYHFFGAFLPSFWIGKILTEGISLFAMASGIAISMLWVVLFAKKFNQKMG
ncbi:MAG: hypothetical protein FWH28_02865 [Clostridiales bacterium]|nr:hypothetical protein [Clostridiales bacterium]